MKVLSIIPARGGSRSIKYKNLARLDNKPLIYYSIKQSLNCKLIDKKIVSTDDKKIARLSLKYGAEVPFLRPKNISKSSSKDYSFFKHTLDFLKKQQNYQPDLIVQLRPTQPYRSVNLISQCISKLTKDKKADSLRTISIPERTPFKMWKIKGKYLEYLFKNKKFLNNEFFNLDRRKLPEAFWHDGVVDIVKYRTIMKYKNVTGKNILYIKNSKEFLIDIDDPKDLRLANLMIKNKMIKINVN